MSSRHVGREVHEAIAIDYTVDMATTPGRSDRARPGAENPEAALSRRARSFGTNAELYDVARPTYPAALVEDLLAGEPRAILDVGCGTGRAALLFEGAGRQVLGIEPDARMAAVAARRGIAVELGTFEDWDPAGRLFDLLIAAQAWHWVDPVAGALKAADVLRPGGRFAAFWNIMHHAPAVQAVFDAVYGRYAPGLLTSSVALGAGSTLAARTAATGAGLREAQFRDVTTTSYAWPTDYAPPDWIGLLRTHSDHEILAPAILEPLLRDLEAGLAGLGPTFTVDFRTELLTARR
jgi:SAM-dependent methyltransferase